MLFIQVTVRVDEGLAAQNTTEGDFMLLTASREFLVGGAADISLVPGHGTVSQNFRGNLRDVSKNWHKPFKRTLITNTSHMFDTHCIQKRVFVM